jgi:tRNA(Ile)-lysidine synthase
MSAVQTEKRNQMLPDITKKTEDKVIKTMERHGLATENQHIVMGLSGGPDSVCLFHILMSIKDQLGITIHPVHVNHKFRPGAAEKDQQYVEELCMRNGLTCRTFVIDCNKLAEELHMTSEEAGRKARYDAFYETAEELALHHGRENIRIAVAQNANDQAETLLFRLLRGTGTDGLAGIAYCREERGYKVIRPLLDVYRTEIEEYCEANKLDPAIDHTNSESIYARNKIRLELIPLLEKEYNESIQQSMVRLARIAAADKDYMWRQTEEAYAKLADVHYAKGSETAEEIVMSRQELAALHEAVRHRVVLKAFGHIGLEKDISEERIASADNIIEKKQAPKTVEFPHGYRLTVAKGQVHFYKKQK